jgi:hypothetical protein
MTRYPLKVGRSVPVFLLPILSLWRGSVFFVLYTKEKTTSFLLLAKKQRRPVLFAERAAPRQSPPKVAETRDPSKKDLGSSSRDCSADSGGKPPKVVKDLPFPIVRVEPVLLNGLYNNPRTGLWRKVGSKVQTTGLALSAPISFQSVRAVFYISSHLVALRNLCENVKSTYGIKLAKQAFHQSVSFCKKDLDFTRGSVIDAQHRMCAIALRFAEKRLRLEGVRV